MLSSKENALFVKVQLALISALFGVVASAADITGSWVLNEELTEEMQPKVKGTKGVGGGFSGGFIGAGGIMLPIPGTGGGGTAAAQRTLKLPIVLDCSELNLSKQSVKVNVSCNDENYREFFLDDRHGRKTKWRDRKFTESYKSTSRTVKHEFRWLRGDILKVTVSIRQRGNRSQEYVRVFDRKSSEPPSTEAKPVDDLGAPASQG